MDDKNGNDFLFKKNFPTLDIIMLTNNNKSTGFSSYGIYTETDYTNPIGFGTIIILKKYKYLC